MITGRIVDYAGEDAGEWTDGNGNLHSIHTSTYFSFPSEIEKYGQLSLKIEMRNWRWEEREKVEKQSSRKVERKIE